MRIRSYDSPMPFYEVSSRYSELMDAPIQLVDENGSYNGKVVSTLTLADRAYQHEWFGKQLRTQTPRYGHYFENVEDARIHLHTDADHVGHQYELAFHAAQFLIEEGIELSDENRGILMLALLIHDMGEPEHEQISYLCGGTVGDIPAGKKTDADRELEAKIRQMFYVHVLSDVPGRIIKKVEAIISHKDGSILHDIFEVAHELQSLETGKIAELGLRKPDADPALETISENVRSRFREKLGGALATKYFVVSDTLQELDSAA